MQVYGGQLLQRDISDGWFDVVFDESLVGFVRGWPDTQLGVVLQPGVQPLTYGVRPALLESRITPSPIAFFSFSLTSA